MKQEIQKRSHDTHTKQREFQIRDQVFVEEFPSGKDWLKGTVTEVKGPLTYNITLPNGRVVHRHVDHIRSRTSQTSDLPITSDPEIPSPNIQTDSEAALPNPQPREDPQPRRSARE